MERAHRRSPYKGLIPYEQEDADFFFGRERETRRIIANLFASSLTLLYGPSGVGKTSVLEAGVMNRLNQRDDVLVASFRGWQSDPVAGLKAAIASAAHSDTDSPSESASLSAFIAEYARQSDRHVMVILDQFEEYFLYLPDHDGEVSFAREFALAVNNRDARASFLVSIREDALSKLDRFKGRIPNLLYNYLRIDNLDRDAARDAIEMPIEQYN